MGKSDDSISRRNNKKARKKQDNKSDSSSKLSARVAAIVAAKKRRKTGKRRMCQGMCFSLPTQEDPFNDKHGKEHPSKKGSISSQENEKWKEKNAAKLLKVLQGKFDAVANVQELDVLKFVDVKNGKSAFYRYFSLMSSEIAVDLGKPTCQIINQNGLNIVRKECGSENSIGCPSKFLITCLNSIQTALERDEVFNSERDEPFLASAWGLDFWNFYSSGKDVWETDLDDFTLKQIAWIASTAADSISMKETEGQSMAGPFLLYLVPSQEKASKVRQVCKPLKALGIHTVSLHSGASLDHQIHGLKTCEPEFIVSTPMRFLELVNLKAVDASAVSLLVISGLESPFMNTNFDTIKAIRQSISGNPRTVVFSRCMNKSSASVGQTLG